MKKEIRIGCGAGFSGDRIEPAVVLAEKANLDFLVLECLAERTIALAQQSKKTNPKLGYDPLLEKRLSPLLPLLIEKKIKLLTNMGAANPLAAAEKVIELAKAKGIKLKVAVITGDDVFEILDPSTKLIETGAPVGELKGWISANAYLGTDAILPALKVGADIIITGRVADPSLFLAPMIHSFNWDIQDHPLMGQGIVIGHLLECAGQITGGYYMDGGKKAVPDPANLGFPFATIERNGTAVISKAEGTGGMINLQTAKEQLLYEVIDPGAYLTPDVSADFSTVQLSEEGPNLIRVKGGSGSVRPATLKVSIGYQAGFLGEGEISYAGTGAKERAELAGKIILERIGKKFAEIRLDFIGMNSLHHQPKEDFATPYEIRLRVSALSEDPSLASEIGEEVEALYTNGPAGGGAARKRVTEVIGIRSALVPREKISPKLTLLES